MIKNAIKIILLTLLFSFNVFAQSTPIAKVVWLKGSLTANGRALQKRSPIYQNDVLRTGSGSQAQIVFSDNALMTLKENTNFSVDNYQFKKSTGTGSFTGNLVTGGFRTITGMIAKHDPEDYSVKTPVATLGVRGTDYQAVMNNGALYVEVFRGKVCMNNSASAPVANNTGLANWLSKPAVYLPQVLAITDEEVQVQPLSCPDGIPPTLIEDIEDQLTISGAGIVDIAPFFSGSGLRFTLDSISPALEAPDTVTVSPSGILTFDTSVNLNFYDITIRATNSCGSVVSNLFEVGPASA